jgi:hypothetical protein
VSGGRKAYGGFEISEFGLRISEFQKGTVGSVRVVDFEPDGGHISNPQSEFRNPKFFKTWPGCRKQEKRSRTRLAVNGFSALRFSFLIFPANNQSIPKKRSLYPAVNL